MNEKSTKKGENTWTHKHTIFENTKPLQNFFFFFAKPNISVNFLTYKIFPKKKKLKSVTSSDDKLR